MAEHNNIQSSCMPAGMTTIDMDDFRCRNGGSNVDSTTHVAGSGTQNTRT
jgi:hypothetical protein